MKNLCCLSAVAATLLFLPLRSEAQTEFRLVFTGVAFQTNDAGVVVTKPITHQTWLRDFAKAASLPPTSLAVVYHIKGNALGDTIDIVNASTGEPLTTLFGFYFGEDFGRRALTSANSRVAKRLDYIYTRQNDHSLGSALITMRFYPGLNGSTNGVSIAGRMDYLVTPEGTNKLQVCTGTFFTGRAIK